MNREFYNDTKIGIAGDWHSSPEWIGRIIPAFRRAGIRTICQLGDFGLAPDRGGLAFLKSVDYWCSRGGELRVLVTPGNHENWEWLDRLFAESGGQPVRVSEAVTVLPRGWRFSVVGRSFVSLGGAPSVDRAVRRATRGFWSATEAITSADVARVVVGGHAEIMLAHDAPSTPETEAVRRARIVSDDPQFRWDDADLEYSAVGAALMAQAYAGVAPAVLAHGHYHVADSLTLDDGRRIFSVGKDGDRRGSAAVLDLADLSWTWLAVEWR